MPIWLALVVIVVLIVLYFSVSSSEGFVDMTDATTITIPGSQLKAYADALQAQVTSVESWLKRYVSLEERGRYVSATGKVLGSLPQNSVNVTRTPALVSIYNPLKFKAWQNLQKNKKAIELLKLINVQRSLDPTRLMRDPTSGDKYATVVTVYYNVQVINSN